MARFSNVSQFHTFTVKSETFVVILRAKRLFDVNIDVLRNNCFDTVSCTYSQFLEKPLFPNRKHKKVQVVPFVQSFRKSPSAGKPKWFSFNVFGDPNIFVHPRVQIHVFLAPHSRTRSTRPSCVKTERSEESH